jgi:uncharacterized protein (TIGR02186 family)
MWPSARIVRVLCGAALLGAVSLAAPEAQQPPPKAKSGAPKPAAKPAPKKPAMPVAPEITTAPDSAGETIQADLSSRIVPVETDFAGARLILFGAVENSRQTAAEAGIYDIVVVLEGPAEQTVVRRKARTLGVWANTRSLILRDVPSYYAIVSTRPLDEIAPDNVLDKHEIGFQHVYMEIAPGQGRNPAANELDAFKEALVRLKQREGLFREDQYGVAFIGKSLFRTTIHLPANVPVGTFRARVFLFRQGKFLSQYTAPLDLERAGLERFVHGFAFNQPVLYGIASVLLAVAAGLLASAAFRQKGAH